MPVSNRTSGPASPPIRLLAVVAVAVLLAACAAAPGVRQMPDEIRLAEQLYRDGDFRAAGQAYLDAADSSRSNREFYRLRAAEAFREEGELGSAQRALGNISARGLDEDERNRLMLLQAEIALDSGAPRLALERLAPITVQRLPGSYRARYHELRGRAFAAEGDSFAAAAEYARLDPLLGDFDRHENIERIRALLAELGDATLVQGSTALPPDHPLQAYAARAMSARGLALPDRVRELPRTDPRRSVASTPRVIALLLPQTGPLRAAAVPVRDGFIAAHFADTATRPELRSYDTGSTPEEAVEAYHRAVAEGAEAVVGPLSREAVTLLFAEARLPVPVLALNRPLGPVPPLSMSFALAPDEEAAEVAARMQQRGLRRVVAVVGSDDNAQRALAGFTARHLQAGGQLLGTVVIPDSGVDYLEPIRNTLRAAGLPTSAPRTLATEHDPGFDAVFLALRPGQARLAVPQLRMFGITRLPLLATSSINAVEDGNRLDRDLNGIEFTEVPWLVSDVAGLPSRARLATGMESLNGPAARLFAFGLDAYYLLRERSTLEYGDRVLEGATGRIELDRFGEARRQPAIAEFRNQRPRLVDNAGQLIDGESAR
jgi:uncharacterized protein